MSGLGGLEEAGWPVALSMAVAMTARSAWAARRRSALNEALHELRRPLQAVALAASGGRMATPALTSAVALAGIALARLEEELNGGVPVAKPVRLVEAPVEGLLRAAVGRWRARATSIGGSIALDWRAGSWVVRGDGAALAQAFDNLIVNAIEHGGPKIVVGAHVRDGRLRITVEDSGRASRPESRRGSPGEVIAKLTGRRRHGHGLAVVRRVAAAHGGCFALRSSEHGTLAVFELPLDDARELGAA